MIINVRKNLDRDRGNRNVFWTAFVIIVITALIYGAYANFIGSKDDLDQSNTVNNVVLN